MRRDVVVTGLGVVSPIGSGVANFEVGLLEGCPNTAPVELFDATPYRTRLAQTVPPDERRPGDPAVAFVLRAALEAVADAALENADLPGCGLALATTAAGWTAGQGLFRSFRSDDDAAFAPLLYEPEELFKEATLHAVSSRFGLRGPAALLSPACAAASSAIAWAAQRIRDSEADLMLAGATDALTEVVFAGFHAMRLLGDDACRPFSAGRRGLVLSEGAAVLVLESADHARLRDAPARARLSGWGLSCDAAHPTTPGSDGVLRAMRAALDDAGLDAGDLDQVSAHGTGSASNDATEADAIQALLGDRLPEVPVTAIKGTTGHTEGAAGAFGAAAGVLSLHHGTLPPLAAYTGRDEALPPLRLTTSGPRHYEGRNVLVNASGFGGANAALLFETPSTQRPAAERRTRRAVITSTLALTSHDGTLPEPEEAAFWPGGRSLPLDRISTLVTDGARRLLGEAEVSQVDPSAAVVLGTAYGSQARHERMWGALAEGGPRDVDPNDFALSTFNAPGAAVAAAHGYGGANLVFLGGTGGALAIEEAARLVASGRVSRVLAGGYDEVTPYFRRVLGSLGECDAADAVALLALEAEGEADDRGCAIATILGHANRAPAAHWPDAAELQATMAAALESAAISPKGLGAIVLDPHANIRKPQLAAIDALLPAGVTRVDLAPVYGNSLAASAPLALHVTLRAAGDGHWPAEAVLRGAARFAPGRPVLINACGFMAGCAALVVQPHAGG